MKLISSAKDMLTKKNVYILLFAILVLGLFLRVYNINGTPPGIYPDEAVNGQDAIHANATGQYQWFYTSNQGREGLFMNLIAFCFKFFGISILTLKLPSIICGTLTILGTYLLAKELFKKDGPALISAFLTAVSFWAINFSRISFRANMLPVILVFTFYFVFKGLQTGKLSDYAIGGIIFGVGMHTYIAFRIAPLILIVLLLILLLSRKNFLREHWKHLLIFFIFSLLAAFPMLWTFYKHPEYLDSRSDSISVFSPQVNNGHLVATFLRSFSLSLLKYNFWGDQNWRHNYPPYPILDTLTGAAFLFGFIYSMIKFIQLLFKIIFKKIRHSQLEIYGFLLFWFFIMLVPEFVTSEGNPHALRSIGTLPVTFIFSGMTFQYLLDQTERRKPAFKKIVLSLIITILIAIGMFNAIKYHIFWANQERVAFSFDKNITEISRFLPTLPPQENKFVITSYNTLERVPIQIFNTQTQNVSYFYPNEISAINPQTNANFAIIFTEKNDSAISEMKNKFPNLFLSEISDPPGSVYYILK